MNTKENILKNVGYQMISGPPLTFWLLIKISSLVFSKRKKFIQVWNNLRVS